MIIRQTNPTSEKDVFRLVTRVRQRKNSEFSRGTKNFFFVPRSWQDKKHYSLFLYQAQNFKIAFNPTLLLFHFSTGTKHRTRRSSEFPPIGVSVLCPGGKSIVTDGDVSWCSDIQGCWRQVYKVHSYSCFQTVRCFSWGCVYLHFTQEVYCLEYQCKEDTSHHIDNTTAWWRQL